MALGREADAYVAHYLFVKGGRLRTTPLYRSARPIGRILHISPRTVLAAASSGLLTIPLDGSGRTTRLTTEIDLRLSERYPINEDMSLASTVDGSGGATQGCSPSIVLARPRFSGAPRTTPYGKVKDVRPAYGGSTRSRPLG